MKAYEEEAKNQWRRHVKDKREEQGRMKERVSR
jgi:hypothetical protein